ncbi:MAG: phospho-N-acetylmuramoyl-pentapeptide-transferase [Bacillota bacterium]
MRPPEVVLFWAFAAAVSGVAVLGVPGVPLLARLRFGQTVRSDGPSTHLAKSGTPTMGGLLFVPVIAAVSLVLGGWSPYVWLALVLTLGHGLLGLADDFLKVALRRPLGLRARYKLAAQIALALVLGWGARSLLGLGSAVEIPFTGLSVELGAFYLPFVILLVLGATNGVNFTDGLDGLASGAMLATAAAYGLIAWSRGLPAMAVFAFAVAGACLGFLVHNHHPARVIMGDTGSLALGGALAAMAVLTRTELWLVLIGGLYVIETLSVIVQVAHFRLTGRRILRMAPLHHHYEVSGWSEARVTFTFWLVSLAFAAAGLWGLVVR